jgi:hypothetical protein
MRLKLPDIRFRLSRLSNWLEPKLSYRSYAALQRFLGYPVFKVWFKERNGYELNLRNPRSFNEKLAWKSLFCRDPLLPIVTDKVRARDWVAERIGASQLIPTIGVYDSADEIPFDDLPEKFVIKPNFQSGTNVIVKCKAEVDWPKTRAFLHKQMTSPYRHRMLAWWTHEMPRKLLIEHFLSDGSGEVPADYKFFCFRGKVQMIQIDLDRFQGHRRALLTRNLEPIDAIYNFPSTSDFRVPDCIEEMIKIAESLTADFDFMRADLYDVAGKIYFGELTPRPEAASGRFTPTEFDFEFGKHWNLDMSARR